MLKRALFRLPERSIGRVASPVRTSLGLLWIAFRSKISAVTSAETAITMEKASAAASVVSFSDPFRTSFRFVTDIFGADWQAVTPTKKPRSSRKRTKQEPESDLEDSDSDADMPMKKKSKRSDPDFSGFRKKVRTLKKSLLAATTALTALEEMLD